MPASYGERVAADPEPTVSVATVSAKAADSATGPKQDWPLRANHHENRSRAWQRATEALNEGGSRCPVADFHCGVRCVDSRAGAGRLPGVVADKTAVQGVHLFIRVDLNRERAAISA